MTDYNCSKDTKIRIEKFEEADLDFKKEWEQFESTHEYELEHLERLRDKRNAALDEARRSLRAEFELVDSMRLTTTEGPFRIQKRFSDYYIPDKLVSMLKTAGLYDTAVKANIISIKIETAKYDEIQNFLRLHGAEKQFACCEDGVDSAIAIGGPKQVPPFGSELKQE